MSQTFLINSFVQGFKHASYEKVCESIQKKIPEREGLLGIEKGTYYLGRTIRFGISVPGVLIDIVLQLLEALTTTMENGIKKGEKLIRQMPNDAETLSERFFYVVSLSTLILYIRDHTTRAELTYLGRDLGLLEQDKCVGDIIPGGRYYGWEYDVDKNQVFCKMVANEAGIQ